jgi:hypothetical protein
MRIGDCLVGEHGRFRALLEIQEDRIAVMVWDMAAKPRGKIIAIEQAPIDRNYAQAKEKAVLVIARALDVRTHEEWDQIRRDIIWTKESS